MGKKFIFPLLLLLISSCAYLSGKEDPAPEKKSVTGRVYFMGSDPDINIGINSFDGKIFVLLSEEETLKELRLLQDNIITVKGYVDAQIKRPQKSIIVEEHKKIEASTVSGRLCKEGKWIKSLYYLQTPEKSYKIVTDRTLMLEDLLENNVEAKGYAYESDEGIGNIYILDIKKEIINN